MSRMIFVNLPVTDLKASMNFYKALGFENNPHFTDATAAWGGWVIERTPSARAVRSPVIAPWSSRRVLASGESFGRRSPHYLV